MRMEGPSGSDAPHCLNQPVPSAGSSTRTSRGARRERTVGSVPEGNAHSSYLSGCQGYRCRSGSSSSSPPRDAAFAAASSSSSSALRSTRFSSASEPSTPSTLSLPQSLSLSLSVSLSLSTMHAGSFRLWIHNRSPFVTLIGQKENVVRGNKENKRGLPWTCVYVFKML